jgi:hypothetical protein
MPPSPFDLILGLDRSDQKAGLCLLNVATGDRRAVVIVTAPETLGEWLAQVRLPQFSRNRLRGQPMQLDGLVPGGMAANEFHLAARTIQGFRQQSHECFVGCGIHGGRGDFDAEFIAQDPADFILRRAWLQLDGKQNAVRLDGEKSG